MKRLALFAALAAVAAAPAAAAHAGDSVLAELSHGATAQLVRVDPATLAILPGPRAPLGRHDEPWARSPDGAMLAVGTGRAESVRLVDLRTLRVVRDLALPGMSSALAWPTPERILVVVPDGPQRLRALALDPGNGAVLRASPLGAAALEAAAATRAGLVLLLGRTCKSGPARLALVAPDGAVRSVALPGFPAGFVPASPTATVPVARYATPALAVDATDGRAYVVAHAPQVAVVDLRTLRVRVHALPERSLADGGISVGFYRRAVWAGGGVLAVTGHDDALAGKGARARQTTSPFGLRLVDARSWSVRMADPRATAVELVGGGGLLATGAGLSLYDRSGTRRWHVFGGQQLGEPPTTAGRVFVGVTEAYGPHGALVLDLATGKRVSAPNVSGWLSILADDTPHTCWC